MELSLPDIKHSVEETKEMGDLGVLWSPKMFYLLK